MAAGLTPAESKMLDTLSVHGEVWIVPSQHRVARRLAMRGLLHITDTRRSNVQRGSTERLVVRVGAVLDKAAAVREVLIAHLALLHEGSGGWPTDPPHLLLKDLCIGEHSAVEHCRKVAERIGVSR